MCFCKTNKSINKTKRKSTEWEKIFANDMANKDLLSKIYNQLNNKNKQTNNPIKKIGRIPK